MPQAAPFEQKCVEPYTQDQTGEDQPIRYAPEADVIGGGDNHDQSQDDLKYDWRKTHSRTLPVLQS
jgi:hypothetical protein